MKKEEGFTLVELTVVLVIIAILIGGLLMPLSSQDDIKRRSETINSLKDAKDAINGYLMINGKVPCPATVLVGPESVDGTGKCTDQTGFLPKSLGIHKPTDEWGRPIRYTISRGTWSTSDTATVYADIVTTVDSLKNQVSATPIPLEKLRTDVGACSSANQFSEVVIGVGTGPIACAAPSSLMTDKIGAVVWSDGADPSTASDNLSVWTAWPTLVLYATKH